MNSSALFHNTRHEPYPLTLPAIYAQSRRQRIGDIAINDDAMDDFNGELRALTTQAPTVNADQISSLVRWLQTLPTETAVATINLRMARVETLRRMLHDAHWEMAQDFNARCRQLLAYINRFDDLIPDDLPLIGHLDDALLIELSWGEFAGEVQDYLDFCRFRSENKVRGNAGEQRNAWETNCLAQAHEILLREEIRSRGYSRPTPLPSFFRVS
ncbi:MAG TPA: YkvA family protein [Arenimonas sp.]|uniref:YkvA family protein n=1 Tax=Arenimonas sp. TaxID=1872635 RepID=UPI002B5282A7|nr:YkvA family protein [Arenimonas sp.]HMB57179.1 YkvA family protein [Arenimonas sp.]